MSTPDFDLGHIVFPSLPGGHSIYHANEGTGLLSGLSFVISRSSDWSFKLTNQSGPTSVWTSSGAANYTAGFKSLRTITRRMRNPLLRCSFGLSPTMENLTDYGAFIGFTDDSRKLSTFDSSNPFSNRGSLGLSITKDPDNNLMYFKVAHNEGPNTGDAAFAHFPEPFEVNVFLMYDLTIQAQEENDGFLVTLKAYNSSFPGSDLSQLEQQQSVILTGSTPENVQELRVCALIENLTGIDPVSLIIFRYEGTF